MNGSLNLVCSPQDTSTNKMFPNASGASAAYESASSRSEEHSHTVGEPLKESCRWTLERSKETITDHSAVRRIFRSYLPYS